MDPDGIGDLNGRSVMLESLRQMCIYKIKIDSFFEYMKLFDKNCMSELTEECSFGLLRKIGIDSEDITKCVNGSFQNQSNYQYESDNTILANDLKIQKKNHVLKFPDIYINGVLYEGTLSSVDLLLSACSGLHDSTLNCRNLEFNEEDSFSVFTLVLVSVLIYVVCVLLMAVICRRMIKKKYQGEFNKMVDKYVGEYTMLKESSQLN